MLAVGAAFGINGWSHEDNADNAPKELACASEQTTYGDLSDTISELSGKVAEDGKEYRTAVQYDAQAQHDRMSGNTSEDAPVEVTVCRTDNGNLDARVDTVRSHPEESDR